MNKILAITLLFFSFFFIPTSAYADSASDSASCSFLDVGCQICWIFCFPTSWATNQFNDLAASISAKAPFAYIDTAFAFDTSQASTNFDIQSLSLQPGGGGLLQANVVDVPSDSNIIESRYHWYHSSYPPLDSTGGVHAFNTSTDTACLIFPAPEDFTDPENITIKCELLNSDSAVIYSTPTVPLVVGTNFATSEDIPPLTITLASISAIPQIGMGEVLGASYTVTDSDHTIHDFMFTYERPIVTIILWVILIAYFVTVARRIFV